MSPRVQQQGNGCYGCLSRCSNSFHVGRLFDLTLYALTAPPCPSCVLFVILAHKRRHDSVQLCQFLIKSYLLSYFVVRHAARSQGRSRPHLVSHEPNEKAVLNDQAVQVGFYQIKLDPKEHPFNWPARRKWMATIVIVFMTANITFFSSIHAAAIPGVTGTFACSTTVARSGVTTFLVGFASGPMLFAPLSEALGRETVFRTTMFLFFCFNIGCALSPNLAALLTLRFFSGFFGSPVVTNSGGCLADIWPQSHRSVPFALFTTGSSLGPVLGPVAGGFVSEHVNWRRLCWVVTIIAAIVYTAMLFFLPET